MKPLVVINKDQIAWLISSAVVGDVVRYKSLHLQAMCCEIVDTNQVDHIAAGLMSQPRISTANKKVVAFRLGVEEWFDDSEEVGVGMKLIKVLQQYGKDNLMLVVCIWDDGMPMKYGFNVFGSIVKSACEVIAKFDAIAAAEQLRPPRVEREVSKLNVTFSGELQTVLQPAQVLVQGKRDRFRPFSLDRYYTAVAHLEQANRTLRPGDLHELLTSRCHVEITLVCECFCTLMGRKNPGWGDVRDLLGNANIIKEMQAMDLRTIKPDLIRQVASVLSSHPSITVPRLLRLSQAAATLLKWCQSIVIIYTGLHDIEQAELDRKLTQAMQGEGEPVQETIEVAELRVNKEEGRFKGKRYDPMLELLADMEKTTLGQLRDKEDEEEKTSMTEKST